MPGGKISELRPLASGGVRSARDRREADSCGSDSDAALIERIAGKDRAAHRVIFDRYYKQVFSFVRRRVGDEGLCEEVASDVFFEIWRNAQAFRGESGVSTWIFGIAHFKSLSARRQGANLKRLSITLTDNPALQRMADSRDAFDRIESRDEMRRLLRAMESLPDGQRDVVRLAFMEGRSYQEVATSLGISEGSVKTRVNRARARLRGAVQRQPHAGEEDPS